MGPGRNEPCPCGSGKKFKRCCGAGAPSAALAATSPPQRTTHASDSVPATAVLELARNTRGDAHSATVASTHLDTLFEGVTVAGLDFRALFAECMRVTATTVPPSKVPRRALRAYYLARYFSRALAIDGAIAECGTLRGFSIALLARVARAVRPGFAGSGMHVVDSFEGLSEPGPKDAVPDPTRPGATLQPAFKGQMACTLAQVRAALADYPDIAFHKGWLPHVLRELPERRWAFVHVDVDLYEPTLGCLEYFVPRLAPGGIIVNDDHASPLFPGGGLAWDEYCKAHGLAYAALESGQAVLVQGL